MSAGLGLGVASGGEGLGRCGSCGDEFGDGVGQGGVDGFSGEEESDVERADECIDDEVGVDALGEFVACDGPFDDLAGGS